MYGLLVSILRLLGQLQNVPREHRATIRHRTHLHPALTRFDYSLPLLEIQYDPRIKLKPLKLKVRNAVINFSLLAERCP